MIAEQRRAELGGLQGVAELMLLEQRLRQAPSLVDLGFRLVNDVKHVCPTDVAVLWLEGPRHGRLEAVANLPEPVRDAPFSQWMVRVCAHAARQPAAPHAGGAQHGVRALGAGDLPERLRRDWPEFLPAHGMCLPLRASAGALIGALLLARGAPWQPPEMRVLGRTGEAAAHAIELLMLRGRRRLRRPRTTGRLVLCGILLAATAAAFLPLPLSVLAPAEVVPDDPFVVRAPLDGVIEAVAVRPNQEVAAGESLVALDDTDLRVRLDTALQDLAIAQAEYRQAQQTSMRDREASSRSAVLAARIAQASAEVGYVRSLLERIEVRADRAGVAIIPDRQELIGKPVRIGERLMTIAEPGSVAIEAWLPVADLVPLPANAEAALFLNISAGEALRALVRSIDYRAQVSPGGILAFRVIAELPAGTAPPRIGQRGTLKLYGDDVRLIEFLLRRPWAALRPWIGL